VGVRRAAGERLGDLLRVHEQPARLAEDAPLGAQQLDREPPVARPGRTNVPVSACQAVDLRDRRPIYEGNERRGTQLHEVHHVGVVRALAHERRERRRREQPGRPREAQPARARPAGMGERHDLDRQVVGHGGTARVAHVVAQVGGEHLELHAMSRQTAQHADRTPRGGSALDERGERQNDEDAQGCESIPHMSARIRTLPRRFFHGGSAGAAGEAGGRHIASNIGTQLVMRLISMPISVVTVSLTARTLDPGGFGVWTGVSAYVAIWGVLTDLGLTTVAMQKMAADPDREADWLGALAGMRLLLAAGAAALCAITVPLFLDTGHEAAWILTLTIFSSGGSALMSVFNSRLRAGLALSFGVVQSFLWLGVTVVLYVTGASVVAFAIAYVAVLAVICTLQVRATRRHARIAWRAGRALWKPLMKVAVPLGIASILITIYYQIDSVLLLRLSTPHETGVYGAAYRFLAPLLFLPAAVMSSFFPVLSAVNEHDPARVRRLVQRAAELMAIISLPILAATIALSDQIVNALYGAQFARAGAVLPILMIAFVSICFGSLAGFLAPLLNLHWRLALYSGIGAIANVALNVWLIPRYGALGSAWATVATEVLTMTMMLGTALYALRLRVKPWRLLGTLAVAAAMLGAMELASPLGMVPAAIVGGLGYVGGLFALRVLDLDELRALRASRSDAP
jgi:O-antigen/teichoic acid export membrane protein